ncbi:MULTISPECIES: flagellar brake domain-containing protein [Aliagarivorans]|uniref:flagellar brake domain-containing protein n=1 Tax=Aliagarivorans TaxID=882379 RepID=UPI000478FE7D|nr:MULTISPECIES: flagellar brake domain-containing protein [Aliagarivorans]
MTRAPTTLAETGKIASLFSKVPQNTQVDLQFTNASKSRLRCKLLGYGVNQMVILQVPQQAKVRFKDLFVEGTGMVARTIAESTAGQCLAFRSVVLHLIYKPTLILFISYPKQLQIIDLRHQQRFITEAPCTLTTLADEKSSERAPATLQGLLTDYSEKGCRIKLEGASEEIGNLKDHSLIVSFDNQQAGDSDKPEKSFVCSVINQTIDGHGLTFLGCKLAEGETVPLQGSPHVELSDTAVQ